MRESATPVGIMSLDGTLVTGRGSLYDADVVANPRTQTTVAGATTLAIVERPDTLIAAYQSAASTLVGEGAELLVSNCGLSMTHQSAVTDFTTKPTIMSSLLLLPMLWKVFGGGVGLLTYDSGALASERLRRESGWTSDIQPVIGEVRGFDSWLSLERSGSVPLPLEQMEDDLKELVSEVISRGGDRVILVECTAMLPHTSAIRRQANVPVFDVASLTNFIRTGMGNAFTP